MSKIIPPTRGRIVLFHPGEFDDDLRPLLKAYGPEPMAATVCHVWGDRMVNLDVVDPEGKHWRRTSVHLSQPGDPPEHEGAQYCTWMPYQVGQATMAERAAAMQIAVERLAPEQFAGTGYCSRCNRVMERAPEGHPTCEFCGESVKVRGAA